MLVIEISQIPPDGMDVAETLDEATVHVEGEESFGLERGELRCRVERGDDASVHVRGHLDARLDLECGRCLRRYLIGVDQELDLFYLMRRAEAEEVDEVELTDRDVVVAYYRGPRLDLGEMVREQLFLSVPMKRLCRDDCRGLCSRCGTNRNEAPCGCPPEPDSRMAPLAKLFDKGSS